jgi:hypothetical protein
MGNKKQLAEYEENWKNMNDMRHIKKVVENEPIGTHV